ncbi:MAG: hypothetical protein LAT84_11050 [Balneolia bacterium]|nr:hypothetical protein [Balneolia bacterium]
MKTFFLAACFLTLPAITQSGALSAFNPADTTDYEVPQTVHQAVFFLAEFLGENEIELIRESDEVEFVGNAISGRGLGSWLINEWDLWSPTPLNVFFNRNGISNPPEMAEVILTSLHRYLNNRPMHINDQIREIRAFWEEQEQQLEQRREP